VQFNIARFSPRRLLVHVKISTAARRFAFVCVSYAFLTAGALLSALPNVTAVARLVDEHYNRLQTLRADFTEIYQAAGTERTESGVLWLKKPGKMRWDYRSPEEKLFVDDGHNGWLYLPSQKQVRKSSMRKLDDVRSPLAFLLGKTKLEKELSDLSFAPDLQTWQAGDMMLRGVPKALAGTVREVVLEITPDHQIVRILIDAVDDSVTEYRFSNQRENAAVPGAQFQFTPPAGTEVIEDETGG
jgi:outer membrane lipoprotein carrier protein